MKYWVCAFSETYEAQAKVLEASVKQHSPEHSFMRLPISGDFTAASRIRLNEALAMLHLGVEEVVVTGADCWLTNRLTIEGYSAALFCPHTFELPAPDQMWTLMRGGVINSDFQVWRQGAKDFLEKFINAMDSRYAANAFELEQAWLPLALSCIDGRLIDDPSIGVAYYNLHEREIDPRTKLIHFSGWHKDNPTRFTKYPCRELLPYEREILTRYAQLVKDAT